MSDSLIEFSHLSKIYDTGEVKTYALRDASCLISSGEFVAIMGPSGSGKSTLMHILGLLDRQTEGSLLFEGKDVSLFDDDRLAQLRNQRVGFVFQSFNLLPRASVFENVEMPLLYDFYSERMNRRARVEAAVASVDMSHRLYYRPNQLSGGEKQRVAIARALVNEPDLIFADEPTGNLDSKSGLQVMSILQDLNEKGSTIVLVTHETATAEHAKRIIRMQDGSVVGDGHVAHRRFARSLEDAVLK